MTYNVRGFQSGKGYVSELLKESDILLLQEHWLPEQCLSDLDINDDFVVKGVSGMDPTVLIRGRPYSGCAIYYRKNFAVSIAVCQVTSKRFCSIRINLANDLSMLLVCVYMPYDNGLPSGEVEFCSMLGELEGFLDTQRYDYLAVIGDFNVDFSRTDRPRTHDLLRFMRAHSITARDLSFSNINFTYESNCGHHRSWVDHFLISSSIQSKLEDIRTSNNGANLSDHHAILATLVGFNLVSTPISVSKLSVK